MSQTFKSRLLRSVFALGLVAAASGCSSIVPNDGEATLNAGKEIAAEEVNALIRVADATRERGDSQTAAALYKRAHEKAPERVDALLRLGYTLSGSGASAEAGEAFRRVLRLEPENAEALRGLGMAMLQRSQVDLAIEHFETALDIDEDVRLYNALGVAFDMKSDHQAAQAYYRVGMQIEPENLSLRSNYGLSLALAGSYDEAIGVLSSLGSDPMAGPQHRQILAMVYGLAGDTQAAGQTAGIDLGPAAVEENLQFYRSLKAMQSE